MIFDMSEKNRLIPETAINGMPVIPGGCQELPVAPAKTRVISSSSDLTIFRATKPVICYNRNYVLGG